MDTLTTVSLLVNLLMTVVIALATSAFRNLRTLLRTENLQLRATLDRVDASVRGLEQMAHRLDVTLTGLVVRAEEHTARFSHLEHRVEGLEARERETR